MTTSVQVLVGLMVVASVLQLAVLVRQRRLRAKYLLLWGGASVLLVPVVVTPDSLDRAVRDLGVDYPPAAYLGIAAAFLYGVCMHFSWELSRLEERSRDLAEEVALLQARLERIEEHRPPDEPSEPTDDD